MTIELAAQWMVIGDLLLDGGPAAERKFRRRYQQQHPGTPAFAVEWLMAAAKAVARAPIPLAMARAIYARLKPRDRGSRTPTRRRRPRR